MSVFDLDFQSYRTRFDSLCIDYLQKKYQHLDSLYYQQLSYALTRPAKRIRPLVIYASVLGCGADLAWADALAISVECAHTYSLIHDDLPCMDDDSFRRGWPSLHKRYSEGVAVLMGDAFLTESFGILTQAPVPDGLKLKALSSLYQALSPSQLIYGQWRDLYLAVQSLEDLYSLHAQKTGELLSFCCVSGALHQTVERQEHLARIGRDLGVAFQLQDDLLDLEGDQRKSFYPLIAANKKEILDSIQSRYVRVLDEVKTILAYPELMTFLISSLAQRHLCKS